MFLVCKTATVVVAKICFVFAQVVLAKISWLTLACRLTCFHVKCWPRAKCALVCLLVSAGDENGKCVFVNWFIPDFITFCLHAAVWHYNEISGFASEKENTELKGLFDKRQTFKAKRHAGPGTVTFIKILVPYLHCITGNQVYLFIFTSKIM